MSHYAAITTKIKSQTALLAALADMGKTEVEVHKEPQHLFGWHGDQRAETAEVIIRRAHIGCASNDVGFKRQPDGTYQAIISDYDRSAHLTPAWMGQFEQRYALHTTLETMSLQGFTLEGTIEDHNGELRLTMTQPALL